MCVGKQLICDIHICIQNSKNMLNIYCYCYNQVEVKWETVNAKIEEEYKKEKEMVPTTPGSQTRRRYIKLK